jgi:hypothetical protein
MYEPFEQPYCDNGCGDHATMQMQDVGLCDDCAASALREALAPLMGHVCGNIARRSNGFITVCTAPYGVEHAHD